MPFDGTPGAPDAVALLTGLEALLDGGKRWTRGDFTDGSGRFCLRGGLDHLRGHCAGGDGQAELFLLAAVKEHFGYEVPIVQANDGSDDFALVLSFIARARQLALIAHGAPEPEAARAADSPTARAGRA